MASEKQVRGELAGQEFGDGLVERLAVRIGAVTNASVVFGEAVKRGDVKVIPVARARWAFGGGSGVSPDGSGGGGGGGVVVSPIGYIEIREDGAEFKPIRNRRWVAVGAAALAAAAIAAATISRRR
jgi:uncharacterized spore protein YtfJ